MRLMPPDQLAESSGILIGYRSYDQVAIFARRHSPISGLAAIRDFVQDQVRDTNNQGK